MSATLIRLAPGDNVAVAVQALPAGTPLRAVVPGASLLRAAEPIPAGHKMALAAINPGGLIIKYGQPIGVATAPIGPGAHVHVHNLAAGGATGPGAESSPSPSPSPSPSSVPGVQARQATFKGFRRADGRVGTRNYLGVLSSVNCSATVARLIADAAAPMATSFGQVDGIVALSHGTGCGLVDGAEGHANLQRVLWGFARHPNFAGILLVGLGCEVNRLDFLLEAYGLERGPRLQTLDIQALGGTRRTVEAGCTILGEMLPVADAARRETVPASELTVALQCGGSDAFSGVTANPALGAATDRLVQQGGTAILAETPEIYGAEALLTRRAARPEVAGRLLERIAWWQEHVARHGGSLDNNPSPGNRQGGITTILEKSLGAAAKAGSTPLMEVYRYAEPVGARGLVFMDSPGYDPCSVTGQIAGGATLVAFTTGRGSVSGFKPAPCLKLASTSDLCRRLPEDIDIDCGPILDGTSVEDLGSRIFARMLDAASGERTCSERQGFGDHELVPWPIGAVL